MSFNIGGKQYFDPSEEAGVITVETLHNMVAHRVGEGVWARYLFLNTQDFYEHEAEITAACWQYGRKWEHIIEPVWHREIPRGMMTLLSESEYAWPGYIRVVIDALKAMQETPELLPVF